MLSLKEQVSSGTRLLIGRSVDVPRNRQWDKYVTDRPGAIFIVQGAGEISYGGARLDLREGDMAVYDAQPCHVFRSRSPAWRYIYFHFPKSMIEKWQSISVPKAVSGVWNAHFGKSDAVMIMTELQEAYTHALLRNKGWDDMVEALFRLVLARFFRKISETDEKETEQLQPAVHILMDFKAVKNMAELAKLCGMSRTGFFRKFRSAYGCTPMEYRNDVQISQAKILLCSTNFRIREIAEQLHFQDCYYFSKFFKNRTGHTPSGWRRANAAK